MEDTKKQIIIDLNNTIEGYKLAFLDCINKDPKLHTKTVMINTLLQRSMSVIDAYKKIISSNNIMVLNSLMRMQIDNCIFIYGVFLLNKEGKDISEIYKEIFREQKRLFEYKLKSKQKLYDTFIVEEINKDIPNFKNLYDFCCRFIHYSNTASLFTMQTFENYIIEFDLSTNYKRFRKQVIINGRSFEQVSKLVLNMIKKYWNEIELGNPLV